MSKKVERLVWVAIILLTLVMLYSGYKVITIAMQYREDQEIYSDLSDQFTRPSDGTGEPEVISGEPVEWVTEAGREILDEVSPKGHVDFHSLIVEVNPEICGWIYCEDTRIDYPIVQHTDNQFYLTHNAKGQETAAGAIYIDALNLPDFQDVNTVIHGHHLNDGSMFGRLGDWAKQDYFDAHSSFYINTPQGNYKLQMIAYFVTPYNSDAYKMVFSGEEEVLSWLEWVRSESLVSSDYSYQDGDHFITLSTCMYNFQNARGVCIGYLIPIAG